MKKFVFVISFVFMFVINSNAQFVGGETKTSKGAETIMSWDGYNKSLSHSNDDNMYAYIHIMSMPRKNVIGVIESTMLCISLGTTKEDAINTLNAYRNLIEKLGSNEQTEITDTYTGVKYTISKDTNGIMKNTILFIGGVEEKDNVKTDIAGYLSVKDIEKMIKALKG